MYDGVNEESFRFGPLPASMWTIGLDMSRHKRRRGIMHQLLLSGWDWEDLARITLVNSRCVICIRACCLPSELYVSLFMSVWREGSSAMMARWYRSG